MAGSRIDFGWWGCLFGHGMNVEEKARRANRKGELKWSKIAVSRVSPLGRAAAV